MADQQGPENHLSYEDLARDLAGDPQDVYGPDSEPAPAPAAETEPSLSDQLSEQINKVLDQYTRRLIPQLAEVMDKKIAAAINGLTAVGAGQNGHAQREELPVYEPEVQAAPGDKLVELLLQLAPAFLTKLMGGGAGQGNALGGFEAQLTQYANMMNIAKGTFVDTHMDSMRTGMKLTADAYTYAYKATGVVPDNVGFNAQVDSPVGPYIEGKPAEAEAVLGRRRQVDVDAIAKSLVPKLTE